MVDWDRIRLGERSEQALIPCDLNPIKGVRTQKSHVDAVEASTDVRTSQLAHCHGQVIVSIQGRDVSW